MEMLFKLISVSTFSRPSQAPLSLQSCAIPVITALIAIHKQQLSLFRQEARSKASPVILVIPQTMIAISSLSIRRTRSSGNRIRQPSMPQEICILFASSNGTCVASILPTNEETNALAPTLPVFRSPSCCSPPMNLLPAPLTTRLGSSSRTLE